jgi:hypothetical protein
LSPDGSLASLIATDFDFMSSDRFRGFTNVRIDYTFEGKEPESAGTVVIDIVSHDLSSTKPIHRSVKLARSLDVSARVGIPGLSVSGNLWEFI